MTLRQALYLAARLMGDAKALQRGRLPQRLHNRLLGRLAARLLAKFWR
jgi:hypothetical protein